MNNVQWIRVQKSLVTGQSSCTSLRADAEVQEEVEMETLRVDSCFK